MKDAGIVVASIGGAVLLFAVFQIMTDLIGTVAHYAYKPPLTQHEVFNLVIFGISFFTFITGVALWVRGYSLHKTNTKGGTTDG